MENEVIVTPYFEKDYKRYLKKFASLEKDLDELIQNLIDNPIIGESLGANIYKIRLAVKSKGAGKSSGFRVITYLTNYTDNGIEIYLITLYDKSETSNITKAELVKLVNSLLK